MADRAFSTLLESLDEEGAEKFGSKWDARLTARIESLAASYGDLRNAERETINYGDLTTHAAYVYTYAQCRAEFVYRTLTGARATSGKPLFAVGLLKVCSLGGGPGSELVGLLRYLGNEENGKAVSSISYHSFDKEKSWENTASALCDAVGDAIPVSFSFSTLDVTNEDKSKKASWAGFDLIIMSYFISEVAVLPEKLAAIASLNHLFKSVCAGTGVIYCDNEASTFYYFFNYRKNAAGKYEQIFELKEKITADAHDADVFSDILERTGRNQHLVGKVLSKYLVRS